MVVIGIDPGKSGWAVPIHYEYATFKPLGRFRPNTEGLKELDDVLTHLVFDKVYVFIEDVHSMPGQGVVSMFTFGFYTGIWYGFFSHYEIRKVRPVDWQKWMCQKGGYDYQEYKKLEKKDKKKTNVLLECKINSNNPWPGKVGHDLADAILIGMYGFDKLNKEKEYAKSNSN